MEASIKADMQLLRRMVEVTRMNSILKGNMLNGKTSGKIMALAVALPTTALFLYWMFMRRDDEDDECNTNTVQTSRQTVIKVIVPGKAVGAVIGQQGNSIKQIQDDSGAKIQFMDRDSDAKVGIEDRELVIRGTTEAAQKAEVMIHQIINNLPDIVTEEVEVPGYCIGRIIGRGGAMVRQMSVTSRCKIFIDRMPITMRKDAPRCVTITGPADRIAIARTMLEEKVSEEEIWRAREGYQSPSQQAGRREPLTHRVLGIEGGDSWDADRRAENAASPDNDFMEMYVSVCEHPGHFWVQMSCTRDELNKLVDDMTAFYNNPKASQGLELKEVSIGDLVAAPFVDSQWFRAEVANIVEDKYEIYFNDFGDMAALPITDLRVLRPQDKLLPYQSVECKLAFVKPIGENWCEEAIILFEDLTQCGKFTRELRAKTEGYDHGPYGPIPSLQIFALVGGDVIDLGAELVSRGYADWDLTPPINPFLLPSPNDTLEAGAVDTPRNVPRHATARAAAAAETVRPDVVPPSACNPST